jgi:predicted DCC family thiol-disulfide oxidoreductase YuxK
MTQTIEPITKTHTAGTIYFDASCGLCSSATQRLRKLVGHRFAFVPLQAAGVTKILNPPDGAVFDEIKLQKLDGRILGGVDALLEIIRHIWWLYPLWLLCRIPGTRILLRPVYQVIARNRHRISRVCRLQGADASFIYQDISVITDKTDITVLTFSFLAAVLFFGKFLPAWAWMWLLAIAAWLTCKTITWRRGSTRALLRYLTWPGMDPRPFLNRATIDIRPTFAQWTRASTTTLCGIVLLWVVARMFVPTHILLAGWIGMIGTVVTLHFGFFHLLALAWRARGVAVEPLMNRPMRAASVADFWGRWNRGFRDLAYRLLFKPLHRRIGLIGATLATFLFSGLVHDLVISVPAQAGYGKPTLYFMIQGIAVLFEKSCRLNPLIRRAMTWLIVIAPLGLLFHPTFVLNVFVPFLTAIRAISPTGGVR